MDLALLKYSPEVTGADSDNTLSTAKRWDLLLRKRLYPRQCRATDSIMASLFI